MSDISQVNNSESITGISERFEALVRDFGLLRQLEELSATGLSPDDAATRFAGMIASEGLAEYCSIMLIDRAGSYLELRAVGTRYSSRGFALDQEVWHGKRFALGEGIAGRVAATGIPARVDDTRSDPHFIALPDSPVAVRSLLCFPLLYRGDIIGVINLSHGAPLFFGVDRENAMHVVSRRMGSLLGPLLASRGGGPADLVGERWPSGEAASRLLHAHRLHTMGQLAGGIVHDLNNQLTAMVGNLDLALQSNSLERSSELVSRARKACLRGAEIVSSILNFGRAGSADGDFEPLEVRHILGEAAGVLRSAFGSGIAFEVDEPTGSCMVCGDNGQLNQMLVNLGLNARDAVTAAGSAGSGPAIRIGAEQVQLDKNLPGPWGDGAHGAFVRLFVRDNGVGMTPAVQARMYEPFFSTKPNGQGTGLGLSTVDRIVQHHRGWLDVHSAPGHGTTVNVFLPACVADSYTAPAAGEAPVSADLGACVLLVDDEPLVRNLGLAILRRLGYRALVASSGHEALEVYRAHADEIALVVLDLQMPGMGGEAVLKALRAMSPGLPIVYSTGMAGAERTPWPPGLAPTGFLHKPYLIATMAEVVRACIRNGAGAD